MDREAVHQKYCLPFELLEKYENSTIATRQLEGDTWVNLFKGCIKSEYFMVCFHSSFRGIDLKLTLMSQGTCTYDLC